MNTRRLAVFVHDLLAAALAWMAAFWLRFNLDIPAEYRNRASGRGQHAGD